MCGMEGWELTRSETGSRLRFQLPASAVTGPSHGCCSSPTVHHRAL